MAAKPEYPCPCGGKIRWKRERVIMQGVDCGLLDVEICRRIPLVERQESEIVQRLPRQRQ